MKIIREYILGEFIKPLLVCLIMFICLFWIIDLFDNLDEILKAKVPLFVLCDYYFSLTPFIFVNICPIVILLSTIFTLSTLNRHNEIMAIKAIGINLWSIIWLFLTFGIIMSMLTFYINEVVKPNSYIHSINLKEEFFRSYGNKEKNKILENITLYGSNNRIFVINRYDVKRQQMLNMTISENNRKNQLTKQIVAKKAQWADNFWIFYDCIVSEYSGGNLTRAPEHYEEKVIIIDETPKDFERADIQPELMGYWHLKKYINNLKENNLSTNKEFVILYNKIAFPLANFIIIFFAVPFTLTRERSGSVFIGITTSVIVSFSYWGLNAVCLSLGKIGFLSPIISAWLPNILFLFTGIALIEAIKK